MSMLLDEYMRGSGSESYLSDDDLERQLQAGQSLPSPPLPSSRPARADSEQDAASLLTNAFAQIAIQEDKEQTVDTAVKAASHGIKVLAPLLTAITNWVDPQAQSEQLEQVMAKTLQRVSKDALYVASAFGLASEDSPPWLTSQISGQIMEVLIRAIERNNGLVLEDQNRAYLAPLVNLAKQAEGIATSFYSNTHDSTWQIVNALTLASAEVMTEYQAFSYFHSDPQGIAQMITDHLNERVVLGTLEAMEKRFGLSESERAYLGNSLIRQAGRMLAEAWSRNISTTLEAVKEMPRDLRRETVVNGYPLDQVFSDFENMYQGIEVSAISAIRSLSPHREKQSMRAGYANRMG